MERKFWETIEKGFFKRSVESISWNEGFNGLVSEEEVNVEVKAIKNKKKVGPNGMPVDVWNVLGE